MVISFMNSGYEVFASQFLIISFISLTNAVDSHLKTAELILNYVQTNPITEYQM